MGGGGGGALILISVVVRGKRVTDTGYHVSDRPDSSLQVVPNLVASFFLARKPNFSDTIFHLPKLGRQIGSDQGSKLRP